MFYLFILIREHTFKVDQKHVLIVVEGPNTLNTLFTYLIAPLLFSKVLSSAKSNPTPDTLKFHIQRGVRTPDPTKKTSTTL